MYETIRALSIGNRPATLWRGQDAEGRTIFDVTFDHHDGAKVEPLPGSGQGTQAAAILAAEQSAEASQ